MVQFHLGIELAVGTFWVFQITYKDLYRFTNELGTTSIPALAPPLNPLDLTIFFQPVRALFCAIFGLPPITVESLYYRRLPHAPRAHGYMMGTWRMKWLGHSRLSTTEIYTEAVAPGSRYPHQDQRAWSVLGLGRKSAISDKALNSILAIITAIRQSLAEGLPGGSDAH